MARPEEFLLVRIGGRWLNPGEILHVEEIEVRREDLVGWAPGDPTIWSRVHWVHGAPAVLIPIPPDDLVERVREAVQQNTKSDEYPAGGRRE